MDIAMSERTRCSNWWQLLADSIDASKARRREAWATGFTEEEARALLRGMGVTGLNGCEIQVRDLLELTMEDDDERQLRYPRWQFEMPVLRYLPVFQDSLKSMGSWGRYSFFVEQNELLGMTPLDALRAGMHRQVFAAAVAANDDF